MFSTILLVAAFVLFVLATIGVPSPSRFNLMAGWFSLLGRSTTVRTVAAVKRIRGRKLQQTRKRHFRKAPLCGMCEAQGRVTLAQQLDHVQALTNGGSDDGEKQGLCIECHKKKTAQDKGIRYIPKVRVGVDGYPTGGES